MSNKVEKKVAEALDAAGEAEKDYVRLSSGVELYVRQANPNILIRVMTASKRPEPPQVFIKDMGRYMENSDDPDYISRVKAWEMEYNSGMLNALVALGTSLKTLPKGVEGPHPKVKKILQVCESCKTASKTEESSCLKCGAPLPETRFEEIDPCWIVDYKALGLPAIPESSAWRYMTWVLFVAAPKDTDMQAIGDAVKKLSGVREADVRDAETFPGSDEAGRRD